MVSSLLGPCQVYLHNLYLLPLWNVLTSCQGNTMGRRHSSTASVGQRIQWTDSPNSELLMIYEESQLSVQGYTRQLELLWNGMHPRDAMGFSLHMRQVSGNTSWQHFANPPGSSAENLVNSIPPVPPAGDSSSLLVHRVSQFNQLKTQKTPHF